MKPWSFKIFEAWRKLIKVSVPAKFKYADKLDNDMLGWELYTRNQSRDTSSDGVLPRYDSQSIYT